MGRGDLHLNNIRYRHFFAFWLGTCLLFALLFRLLLLVKMQTPELGGDAYNYVVMVKQLLGRGVYGYMSTESNAYVTPGYPLFLAAIYSLGGGESAVRVIQAVLGAATIIPMALLSRDLVGERGALLTALFLAIYPSWLRAPAHLLTEVLFTFLFSWYLWVQWRALADRRWEQPYWPLLSGILLGLAVLVRPVIAPLLPLSWLYLMLRRRSPTLWRAALWAAGGFVLVMLPWWVRNVVVLGQVILTATQAGNPILGGMDPYNMWQGELWQDVAGGFTGESSSQMRKAFEILIWLLRNYPFLTVKWFTFGKLESIFLHPWLGWEFGLIRLVHYPLVVLGWTGALASLRRGEPGQFLSLVLIALTLLQLAFIPENRYAYPLIGILAIVASLALLRIFRGGELHGRGPDHDSRL